MSTFGRYEIGSKFGSGISCSADGSPVAKIAGVQIAWAAVPAVAAARKFKDEDTVEAGEKFIRYGTPVARILTSGTASEVGMFMPVGVALGGRTISLTEGDVFLINRSVHENDILSDHPEALDGGRMYIRRLIVDGYGSGAAGVAGSAGFADSGTYAGAAEDAADIAALGIDPMTAVQFKAALPNISFVTEGNAAPAGSTAV
jgi:hypothetical protein